MIDQFDLDFYINRLFVLHSVEIIPTYRGKNLGLAVATELIREYGRGCDLIVTKPFPIQFFGDAYERDAEGEPTEVERKEFVQAKKKLFAYWSQIGFSPVGKAGIAGMTYDDFMPYQFNND